MITKIPKSSAPSALTLNEYMISAKTDETTLPANNIPVFLIRLLKIPSLNHVFTFLILYIIFNLQL
jgi:hypothetical protein